MAQRITFDGSAAAASAICKMVNPLGDPGDDPLASYLTTASAPGAADDLLIWIGDDLRRIKPGEAVTVDGTTIAVG